MPPPGVPLAKVLVLLEAGRARGARPDAWCQAAGLPDVRTTNVSDARVPPLRVIELWEALVRELDDPGFPIEVAQRIPLDAYDVYGFALLTSPDVRTALGRATRYFALAGNPGRLAVHEDRDTFRVLHDRPGVASPRLGVRCAIECALAQVLYTMRQVLGRRIVPRRVAVAHPAPHDTAAHERFFGLRPAFDALRNELVFERELLSVELPKVHGSLSTFFERHAERLLQSMRDPADASVAAAVRAALTDGAFDAPPDIDAVARRLALSERTLRRRLAGEGQSFRALRDEALRARAFELLARTSSSLVEVAFVLGFSDQTAFQRAFKRWTGKTPQAWRRERNPETHESIP